MPKSAHKHTLAINLVILGIVLLFIGLLLLIPSPMAVTAYGSLVFPSGKAITIEVADDAISRARGLSGREPIGMDHGMLFTFEEQNVPRFWMKGMRFPLDMIWIRGNEVVEIDANVPIEPGIPTTFYFPDSAVDKILEVEAGFTEQYHVQVGDRLEIVLP